MTKTKTVNRIIIAFYIALGLFAVVAIISAAKCPAVEPAPEKYIPLSAPPAVPTPIDRGLTNRMPEDKPDGT